MRAVVLFSAVVLAAAPAAAANAATAGCAQVMQNTTGLAGIIAGAASSYWAHREKFVELTYGELRLTVPNAQQLAAKEKSQADPLKAAMLNTLASFKALVATAQSQNCLPQAKLAAIAEPTIRLATRINFDQFPL
jgi:hypothetical protein